MLQSTKNQTQALVSDSEAWRPRYHYTPKRNWMNDPNGLVMVGGEYHLYYQCNPTDLKWGNIGWGHAVSTDLATWRELPVALSATHDSMAFSGTIVVDHGNTAGFATPGSTAPAIVAVFTSFDPATLIQSQHLAYSRDGGRSFTRYEGNPILDIGSKEFRDPKVFWHVGSGHWVMLVVCALIQEVWFYTSKNLKDWTRVSSFGPAGSAANNIWEMPDLFELPVDDDASRRRWVLVVSVNHGTIWGGSGVQYFVGHFDGTRFVADPSDIIESGAPTAGDLIADFEGGQYPPGWVTTGTAFGERPAAGALKAQRYVSGFLGRGLVNSFVHGDAGTGTLTSPAFTISRAYLSFLIAGGSSPLTRLELRIGEQVARQASGDDTEVLKWQSWDVSELQGQQATVRVVDEATGPWGHIDLDHIVMVDTPVPQTDMTGITLWADHGRDFYAPLTFSNLQDGRVLWLGWMSNWEYARWLPTQPWRGQQSSVRQLDLVTTTRGLRLRQRVADEMLALVDPRPLLSLRSLDASSVAAAISAANLAGRQLMARLVMSTHGLLAPIGLEFFKYDSLSVSVGFDPLRNCFFVDRTTPKPLFNGHSERHEARRLLQDAEVSIEVWIDGSTVEVFADDGVVVLSDLVYQDPQATGVALFHGVEAPLVRSLDIHTVGAPMFAPAP